MKGAQEQVFRAFTKSAVMGHICGTGAMAKVDILASHSVPVHMPS